MAQRFVDSHAHLHDAKFDADRDAVIERARAAGLKYLLAIGGGSGPDELAASVPLAGIRDWIHAAVGIHPHEAGKTEERHYILLRQAARKPRVLAIGEIGLDYHYDHSPREIQKQVLIRQLELATEVKLPIVIHCREAWEDLRAILAEHWRPSGLGGILHCFSGTAKDARFFVEQGFMISFAGNLTFKTAENLRDAALAAPRDWLLTETDCPYLAPVPHRGKRNEPAYVVEVARRLADLLNLPLDELGELTARNFERFFHLVAR